MKIQGPSQVAGTEIKLSYLTYRQKLTTSEIFLFI